MLDSKQFETIDELIEFVYFSSPIKDTTLLLECIGENQHLNVTPFEASELLNKYDESVGRRQDTVREKFANNAYIRRFSKKLPAEIGNQLSLNSIKTLISAILAQALTNLSTIVSKNCYTNEHIDLVIEMISSSELLSEQFFVIAKKALAIENESAISFQADFVDLIASLLGEYLSYMIKEDLEKSEKTKELLSDLLAMDESELKPRVKEFKKSTEEKTKQAKEQNKIGERELLMSIMPKEILNAEESKLNEFLDILQGVEEEDTKESEIISELDPRFLKFVEKAIPYYDKYFSCNEENVDDEAVFSKYMEQLVQSGLVESDDDKDETVIIKIGEYMGATVDNFKSALELGEEDSDIRRALYCICVNNFFVVLSYYLMQVTNQVSLVEEFLTILEEDDDCKENYEIVTAVVKDCALLKLSPVDYFHATIIAAVLYKMDDKATMKKIKKILKRHDTANHDDLRLANKKQATIYHTTINEDISVEDLHQFAVTFIDNYDKNRTYLGPGSAFVYYCQDIFEEDNTIVAMHLGSQILATIENVPENSNDYENNTLVKHDRVLKDLCEKIKSEELSEYYTQLVFESRLVDYSYYWRKGELYENDEFTTLIDKYRASLLFLMGAEDKGKVPFIQLEVKEQIRKIYRWCSRYQLLDQLEKTNVLIPNIKQISLSTENNKLLESVSKLNTALDSREKIIKEEKLKSANLQMNFKDVVRKESNKIEGSYQSEVVRLNKIIKEQKKEIESLSKEKNELYKLREELFALQNDDVVDQQSEEINLSEVIKGKSIVLVGGHIKLIERLRNKYPSLKFTSSDSTTTTSLLVNADHVFILWRFINHTLYYKVMGVMNSNPGIQWDYLSNTNLEKVERELYQKLL